MTAICTLYDQSRDRFIIATDGRRKSDDPSAPKDGETDEAQKIFPIQTDNAIATFSLAGFSGTEDGRFDLIVETKMAISALSRSRFSTGYQYVRRICDNLEKAVAQAKQKGRISQFAKSELMESEARERVFRLFFLGYYSEIPFWIEARFYYREETGVIEYELISEPDFTDSRLMAIGSDIIYEMMYRKTPVDPRISKYKQSPRADSLEYVTSYIKACSDPAASGIDPLCKNIGGHIHAAEISKDGFRWLIPPKAT